MDGKKERLRALYKVDEVLGDERLIFLKKNLPYAVVADSVREEIDILRNAVLQEEDCPAALADRGLFLEQVIRRIEEKAMPSLRPIVNATGTVLHTNLGRALLGRKMMERVEEISTSYSTLEYDVKAGRRGSRHDHVERLICRVTGAEAAMVVNNNAAATMLVLSAMAKGREVIVSRGELVEIGGSFRIPDIMGLSGATLREVGTTNKTVISDYENAVDSEATAVLMKVHTSNYRIVGFTADVALQELRELGDRYRLPVIYDMGNGLLADLTGYGISEPTVGAAVQAGADVMLFSGDKLLGGPQAGIIIGKKAYIESMKRHPLARVARIDKMTLAALEALFFIYQDMEKARTEIPTLRMLTCPAEQLQERAIRLKGRCLEGLAGDLRVEVEACQDFVGGGSAPDTRLEGYALTLQSETVATEQLERGLRNRMVPIISHVCQDKIWLHLRTVLEDDMEEIVAAILSVRHTCR